ncbi:hypothetical protein F4823DRAFT_98721 [Ustulina deusta]|nr:hypothetical protein F4823DRAFT_98721 [Ustulina deusta]
MALAVVKLHVVFAGRGDGLILEVEDNNVNRNRRLVVVDGGPTSHRHAANGGTAGAPYSRYLMAAMRRIWGGTGPIQVASIFNSHPDDDHYKGLLDLVANNIRRADFALQNSFFVPYWPGDDSYREIQALLLGLGFRAKHDTAAAITSTPFIQIKYPEGLSLRGIINFTRVVPPNPTVQPQLDVDLTLKKLDKVKDKNDSSILMEVVQDPNSQLRAIMFTGDGEAKRIKQYVKYKALNNLNQMAEFNRHYSIYKLQHHGSQENQDKSWDTVNIGIPQAVLNEFVIYYLAFQGPNSLLPLWDDGNTHVTVIDKLREYVLGDLVSQGPGLAHWQTVLRNRHREYIRQLIDSTSNEPTLTYINDANPNDPNFNNPIHLAQPCITKFIAQYLEDMSAIQNHDDLTPTQRMIDYEIAYDDLEETVFKSGRWIKEEQDWYWNYFCGTTHLMFSWANRYAKIAQFYRRFTADSYVVSGSASVHGHPTVAVVTGLALALATDNRGANLYMTDPGMMFARGLWRDGRGANWPDLPTAVQIIGRDLNDLFTGNNLNVRFLSHDYYMTLNADIGLIGQRDREFVNDVKSTQLIQFGNSDAQREIYEHLKKNANVLPHANAGRLDRKTWQVVCDLRLNNAIQRHYLCFQFLQGGGVGPHCAQVLTNLHVQEFLGAFPIGQNPLGEGFRIRVSDNNQFNPHLDYYLHKLEENRITYWRIQWLDNQNNVWSFYLRNGGVVPLAEQDVLATDLILNFTVLQTPATINAQIAANTIPLPVQTATMVPVNGQRAARSVADNALFDAREEPNEAAIEEDEAVISLPSDVEPSANVTDDIAPSQDVDGSVVGDAQVPERDGEEGQTFTLAVSPSDELAIPQIARQEVSSSVLGPLTESMMLSHYLELRSFDPSKVLTRANALEALLGKSNARLELVTRLEVYEKILAAPLDVEKSTVAYLTKEETGFDFTEASLPEKGSSATKVRIVDKEYEVRSLVLTRKDLLLGLQSDLKSADGSEMTISTAAKLVKRLPSMRDFLLTAGAEMEKMSEVSVSTLFSFIFKSENKAAELLCSAIPKTLAKESLGLLKPDLDNSEVAWDQTPFGDVHLTYAQIPCTITRISALPQLDLSVVKIEMTQLGFQLTNLDNRDEKIALAATVKIQASGADSGAGLELKLRLEMTDHLAELQFVAQNVKSLVDIAKAISVDSTELEKMPVPLTKQSSANNTDTKSFSSLGSLRSKSTSIGFSLRETGKGSGTFSLSSIFIAIDFNDWTEYLPKELKIDSIEHPKTAITILDPTDAKLRRIKVDAEFQYLFDTVKTTVPGHDLVVETKRYIGFNVTAIPIAGLPDYDFQLDMFCETGLSVQDVLRVVGLDLRTDLKSSFPPLDSLLSDVKMKRLSIGTELATGKLQITDWTIELFVKEMKIVPEEFVLSNLELTITKSSAGLYVCDGSSVFHIKKNQFDKYFKVSCRLPQPTLAGFFEVQAPLGLELMDLFKCFDVDLASVPVINDLFTIQLRQFRIDMGYKSEKGSKLSVMGVSAKLEKEELAIEVADKSLKFTDLSLSFAWFSADSSSTDSEAIKTFTAKATLPGGSYSVAIGYTSVESALLIELLPMDNSNLGDLLRNVLSTEMADVVLHVLGDLALQEGSLLINTKDKCVDQLDIVFGQHHSVNLDKASGAPVSIAALELHYSRRKAPSSKAITDGSTAANGTVTATNDGKPEATDTKDKDQNTQTSLNIAGVVALNDLRAKVEFKYLPAPKTAPTKDSKDAQYSKTGFGPPSGKTDTKPDDSKEDKPKTDKDGHGQMSITVSAVDEKALTLRNFAALFGLGDVKIDSPDQKRSFLDLTLKKAEGVVDILPSALQEDKTNGSNWGKYGKPTKPAEPAKKGKFLFSFFEVVVESLEAFTLIESSPPIQLDKLFLKLTYKKVEDSSKKPVEGKPVDSKDVSKDKKPQDTSASSTSGFEALVYGSFMISTQHIEVAYSKTKRHGSAFIGRWSPKDATDKEKKDLDIGDFADKFLGKAATSTDKPKFNFPTDLNLPTKKTVANASFVFVPRKYLELAFTGESLWEGRFGDDLNFKVDRLGAYFKVSKSAIELGVPAGKPEEKKSRKEGEKKENTETNDKSTAKQEDKKEKDGKYKFEIHLLGQLTISDFTSAQARLDISPDKSKTFIATIAKKPQPSVGPDDASGLAGDIVKSDTTNNWDTLVKSTGTKPFVFEGSVLLFIDFTAARLVATGTLKDLGQCVILGKKMPGEKKDKKSNYGFYLSLVAQNVEQIWTGQKDDVADVFKIKKLAGQFVSYDTTVEGLMDDLKIAKIDDGENKEDLPTDVIALADQEEKPDEKKPEPKPNTGNEEETKSLVTKINDDTKAITPGAWFFADLAFPTSSSSSSYSLSSSLALAIVDKDAPNAPTQPQPGRPAPTLLLYACIMKDKTQSIYGIRIDNVVLLGGKIRLSGGGSYHPGDKNVKGSRRVDIEKARLEIEFSEKQKLDLNVDFHFDETRTWFTARAGGWTLREPFEGMFNVELVNIGADGSFSKTEQTVTISGKVKFGNGAEEKHITAMVLFQKCRPRGVYLKYDNTPEAELPVGDLCSEVLSSPSDPADKRVTWPDTHPNFAFQSATIYYIAAGPVGMKLDNKDLVVGYHLEASVYLFDKPFDLRLDIGASKGKGVTFTAVYKETLDLEIVKLSGYKDLVAKTEEKGPAISVSTTPATGSNKSNNVTLEVKAGVSIFDCDPIPTEMSYETGTKSFFVSLTLPANFLGGTEAHPVGFRYKNGRWSFTGMKVDDEFSGIIKDVEELMKEGSKRKNPGCGALVKFVWKSLIKGKWNFGLSLPEKDDKPETDTDKNSKRDIIGGKHKSLLNKDGKIELAVKIAYNVVTRVGELPVMSVIFNDFPLLVEPKVKKGEIWGYLSKFVTENAENLADKLATDGENLTKLLGVLLVDQLGPEITAALICRGAKSNQLGNRGTQNMNNGSQAAKKAAEEALKQAARAAAAAAADAAVAGGAAVAGEAILTGLAILAAAILALVIIMKLKEAIDKHGTPEEKKAAQDAADEADKKIKEAQAQLEEAKKKLKLAMSIISEIPVFQVSLDDFKKTVLEVDWKTVVPKCLEPHPDKGKPDVTWIVEVANNDKFEKSATKRIKDATSYTFEQANSEWQSSSHFFVRIKALLYAKATADGQTKEETMEATNWSPVKTIDHLPFLKTPTSVFLAPGNESDAAVTVEKTVEKVEVVVADKEPVQGALSLYSAVLTPDAKDAANFKVPSVHLVAPENYPNIAVVSSVRAFVRSVPADTSKA